MWNLRTKFNLRSNQRDIKKHKNLISNQRMFQLDKKRRISKFLYLSWYLKDSQLYKHDQDRMRSNIEDKMGN